MVRVFLRRALSAMNASTSVMAELCTGSALLQAEQMSAASSFWNEHLGQIRMTKLLTGSAGSAGSAPR